MTHHAKYSVRSDIIRKGLIDFFFRLVKSFHVGGCYALFNPFRHVCQFQKVFRRVGTSQGNRRIVHHQNRIFGDPPLIAGHKNNRRGTGANTDNCSGNRRLIQNQRVIYCICGEYVAAGRLNNNIYILFISQRIKIGDKVAVCDRIIVPPTVFTGYFAEKL